jgi:serine/threonine protein phosphatase PrpC
MGSDRTTPAPSVGNAWLSATIRRYHRCLSRRGAIVIGSGHFSLGRLSGSVHTDYGPLGQDKGPNNQDYSLVWLPRAANTESRLRLVVALADGLTSSFRSEWASSLACWAAVRAVIENHSVDHPKQLAKLAFDAAGLAIGRLADVLARDPQASCPPDQYLSTWRYILHRGLLLQTTLIVAWLEGDCLRMAMVGDGGSLLREYDPISRPTSDHVLAQCDLETEQVHALGPASRCLQDFDCWIEHAAKPPFLWVLHTDGLGRGLANEFDAMLDDLGSRCVAETQNLARHYIEEVMAQRPADFADNLTLAVIRADCEAEA